MCGFAGFFNNYNLNEDKLKSMLKDLKHRGPDNCSIWKDDYITIGHTRLKIIDLSNAANQPMVSSDKELIIAFNGEIYNYEEIKTRLSNFSFSTRSDTEVILKAYEKWGENCVKYFDGMFSFVIWDRKNKKLFCARDKFGIKPFYYIFYKNSFVFSSEILPLTKIIKKKKNHKIILEYLKYDLIEHRNETFFEDIYKLEAGTCGYVYNGKIASKKYWKIKTIKIPQKFEDRQEELDRILKHSVNQSLTSDVPIGVQLSGGLDSQILLNYLEKSKRKNNVLATFSLIYPGSKFSEEQEIKKTLRESNIKKKYFIQYKIDNFLKDYKNIIDCQQEPFAGLPIIAYARSFKLARNKNIIVHMDGSGLDELFCGYLRFLSPYIYNMQIKGRFIKSFREIMNFKKNFNYKISDYINYIVNTFLDRNNSLAQDLTDPSLKKFISDDYNKKYRQDEFTVKNNDFSPLKQTMFREIFYTKLPRALRYRDRVSMISSTELRPSFLNEELINFCFSLPETDLINNGVQKFILKSLIKNKKKKKF